MQKPIPAQPESAKPDSPLKPKPRPAEPESHSGAVHIQE
jgi:hypothetical protein